MTSADVVLGTYNLHPDLHSVMHAGNTLSTHLTTKPDLPPPPPNQGRTLRGL
jgi:hypothetical protein